MKPSSTYKILYLINLLLNGNYTKNDIIKEFDKIQIKLNKPTINQYIEKLKQNGIDIKISKIKNQNLYSINPIKNCLNIDDRELDIIDDIKKLLFAQKNLNRIRKTMRLFYKIAPLIKDEVKRERFIDFDYYSTLDWYLVRELENHSKTKDIIIIDYCMPDGENKYLQIQTDKLKIGSFSDRLYLDCILKDDDKLSHLPLDRIYMIKKVLEKNKKLNLLKKYITYTVSNEALNKTELDQKEIIIKKDENYTTIKRPIEDKFYILQRLLYFCPDLYYVSCDEIKKLLIEKLEAMKYSYDSKDI